MRRKTERSYAETVDDKPPNPGGTEEENRKAGNNLSMINEGCMKEPLKARPASSLVERYELAGEVYRTVCRKRQAVQDGKRSRPSRSRPSQFRRTGKIRSQGAIPRERSKRVGEEEEDPNPVAGCLYRRALFFRKRYL